MYTNAPKGACKLFSCCSKTFDVRLALHGDTGGAFACRLLSGLGCDTNESGPPHPLAWRHCKQAGPHASCAGMQHVISTLSERATTCKWAVQPDCQQCTAPQLLQAKLLQTRAEL